MTKTVTNVYAVCDCSGSMAGAPEATMRQLLRDNLQVLADAERTHPGTVYDVTLIPFSVRAIPKAPLTARELVRRDNVINEVNTRDPFGSGTALRDAIGLALEQADRDIGDTPALVLVFTDGQENQSVVHSAPRLRANIERMEKTGNLTVTVAGPSGVREMMGSLGIPAENFRLWDGSEKELRQVNVDTQRSLSQYTTTRRTGGTSTRSFYADASQLTTAGVKAMTKQVVPTAVDVVLPRMAGRAISDYFGRAFQQGKHYYELVKAEYIQDDKELVVFIRAQNEYRLGSRSVRTLLGLPETGKIRVHPSTNQSPYTIFVRSDSVNRKVVEGQTLLTIP